MAVYMVGTNMVLKRTPILIIKVDMESVLPNSVGDQAPQHRIIVLPFQASLGAE